VIGFMGEMASNVGEGDCRDGLVKRSDPFFDISKKTLDLNENRQYNFGIKNDR